MTQSMSPLRASADSQSSTSMGGCRWRRKIAWVVVGTLVLVGGTEIIGRWFFGLGTGKTAISDPDIEYLPKPSSQYVWIGHRESYNEFSMRSDHFAAQRTSPEEIRILVFGDSVVHGGGGVDQRELATELLAQNVAESLNCPVSVGNVSAFSWGPPNLLAYAKRFGFFDSDVVLIVTNNSDAWDVPAPLAERTEPAVSNFVITDLARRLQNRLQGKRDAEEVHTPERAAESIGALLDLVDLAQRSGAGVAVIQHPGRSEVDAEPAEGTRLVRQALSDRGVPTFDAKTFYTDEVKDPRSLYDDHVHLNPMGQRALEKALRKAVQTLLVEDPSNH